ncbi:MAG: HAD family hydrolase [Mangrovibacterium sp.]
MNKFKLMTLAVAALLFASCCNSTCKSESKEVKTQQTPLASWNAGVRQQIIDYVTDVTSPESPNFVPVSDRVATFDNDGTLWSEKPVPFQIFFAIDEIKRLAPEHPEWKDKEPFKSAINGDLNALVAQGSDAVVQLVVASHTNITSDAFTENIKNWISTAKHPTKHVKYTDLVYEPMLELLQYLREHDFKTFIVSGGGITYMRAWAEQVYGIPRNQVIGTSFETQFDFNDGDVQIQRLPAVNFYDDKLNKPLAIERHIGIRPIFAAGNSDGDFQMLQYADANKHKSFQLYISHTDGDREFEYGREDLIAPLNEGMDYALAHGWCIVDMKKDWKTVCKK